MIHHNEKRIEKVEKENIFSIFIPFGGSSLTFLFDKSYENICKDIENETLTLYESKVQLIDLPLPKPVGRETDLHLLLKANTVKLLEDLGGRNIVLEGEDNSDVICIDLKIRVECGHTDGIRLYRSIWLVKEF
jgi:hypothetical protein